MTPLQQLVSEWDDCQRCELAKTRKNVVHGRGSVPCDILVIGQAPGRSEDVLGEPFVGPAGDLLEEILSTAYGYFPDRTFPTALTNVVGCMPPKPHRGDHEPSKESVKACRPRLKEFVRLCQPKLVVVVGAVAKRYTTSDLKIIPEQVPTVEITHPSAILQSPIAKQATQRKTAVVTVRDAIKKYVPKGEAP